MSNRPSKSRSTSSASQRVRAASNAGKGSSKWLWIGIVSVVVVVGVIAIVAGRSSSSGGGGGAQTSTGTVVPNGNVSNTSISVQGAALPQMTSDGSADPALGRIVPTVTGQTFDGSQITIAPDGKPHLIMGVAHWCPHCQAEVPRIMDWLQANGVPPGLEMYAVATSNDPAKPNYPAGDWLRREKWTIPTIVDDKNNQAAAAIGVSGFPYFIITDANGKVVYRTSGEKSAAELDALMRAAAKGQAPSA